MRQKMPKKSYIFVVLNTFLWNFNHTRDILDKKINYDYS